MSIGQIVGIQDDAVVTVRDSEISIGGRIRRLPLADMQRPIDCPVCAKNLFPWRRDDSWFLRHPPGLAHSRQQIENAAALRLGEGDRHHAVKSFLYDDFRLAPGWTAQIEQATESKRRRPDVTAIPLRLPRKRVVGMNRVPTALEVQESPITPKDMDLRARDHRSDGLESVWFKSGDQPQPWPVAANVVTLRPDATVYGIAEACDHEWQRRQWIDPVDLDKFTHMYRRNDVVLTPTYGIVTREAWERFVQDGMAPSPEPTRRQKEARPDLVPTHRSVHGDAPTRALVECRCALCLAAHIQTVSIDEIREAMRLDAVMERARKRPVVTDRQQHVLNLIYAAQRTGAVWPSWSPCRRRAAS